ncbi:spermidine/putrescine ABC transporter permease [Opitutaceae bacterium TAV5]|nr:spermidine/putrescine ABC transporter permease [Opitutaceae bacterium TAV5]
MSALPGATTAATPAKRPRLPSGLKLLEWGLGAWTAIVFVFLYAPIVVLVAYSFNTSRLNILWEGFTFRWYGELVRNRPIMSALTNSLIVAAITTVAAVVIGTSGAWLLHRYRFRFSRSIQTLICVPMIMPEIVMGISLLIFFTTLSLPLGYLTVSIAHVTFCFPFVLVAVQARLQGLDPALEEAALDLGATPLRAFRLVIVPCLRPAILSGGLMAFTLSMDELIVSFFTVGPDSRTLPLLVFGMAKVGLNPMLNALSAIFVVTTAAFVLFSEYLRRLASHR